MKPTRYDIAVIGAGPAGMAAATSAAAFGHNCVVIDEQPRPGGQIYRNTGHCPLKNRDLLGQDYLRGEVLATAFGNSKVEYLAGTTVWHVDGDGVIGLSRDGRAWSISARYILVASGAMERPCPIPGWTLPNVMTAGAGQILLKTSAMIPDGPVVLAGSGPLLFLVAWQYLNAGAEIAGLVETTPGKRLVSALRYLPKALLSYKDLIKGLGYIHALKKARVPMFKGVTDLRAEGAERVDAVTFFDGGKQVKIHCDTLLLHQGVVPNVQISRSLECAHLWDEQQLCWRPRLDPWGCSDSDTIYVAGDGGGIGGAQVAEIQGRLAVLDISRCLGAIDEKERDRRAASERLEMTRHLRMRPFLDALYRPVKALRQPSDETVVCRCEEVTAGDIRDMVRMGCLGPNQTKSFGRPGMGPCQGRLCGLTVSEIIADERGVAVAEVGYYRIRPPLKPITLGELAAFDASAQGADKYTPPPIL